MDIETERLLLTPISPERARQIVAGDRMGDRWHPEYPLVDELDPLRGLAATQDPDPVFTMYVIRQRHDTLAIGGLGFFGPPDDHGRIEFGYGLVPSVRGRGYATEAVIRALEVAAEHGALSAAADTALANLSSQRVLEKAGLAEARRDAGTIFYTRPLTSRHA